MNNVTEAERDSLKEIVNIGVGNAATALSQLLSRTVKITAPDVFIDSIHGVPEFLGSTETVTTAILSDLGCDIQGTMFLMLPPESAERLATILMNGQFVDIREVGGLGESALKEVGNILTGSCMTALSKFLDLNIVASVPHIATDMLGALLDTIIAKMIERSNTVLVFRVHFNVSNEGIDGDLYMLFDPVVTTTILGAMHVKYGS